MTKGTLRVCEKGHEYYKSSDCPTCPVCEKENKPDKGFLSWLSAPARRALQREGIETVQQLSKWTEEEILQLHGMGPGSLPKLHHALKSQGLSFRKP
jgi:DNA-directed RNA polymerase alpha subunit